MMENNDAVVLGENPILHSRDLSKTTTRAEFRCPYSELVYWPIERRNFGFPTYEYE